MARTMALRGVAFAWIVSAVALGCIILPATSLSRDRTVIGLDDPVLTERPEQQQRFVAIVEKAQRKAAGVENDMQLGGLLAERSRALCELFAGERVAHNWTGVITYIGANEDGYGVVEMWMFPDITLVTWNNAVSDAVDNTLIPPSEDSFRALAQMSPGQRVVVSGGLIRDRKTCFKNKNFYLDSKIQAPEYLFQFVKVEPLE